MASQVLSWRLAQGGWSFAVTMKDLQNAFGSVSWQALDKAAEGNTDAQDEELCKQRYRDMVVDLPTPEGVHTVKIGDGLMMGDPFSVGSFATSFAMPTERWSTRRRAIQPAANLLTCEWEGMPNIDLGLHQYADDLSRHHLMDIGTTMQEGVDMLRKADDELDVALGEVGMRQNRGKHATSVLVQGAGSTDCK